MNAGVNAQVASVSLLGFWLILGAEEFFVPFAEFPWFRNVPVSKLANVQRPEPHHLHWPDLDIDLAVDSIRDPKKFPLIARG